LIFILHQVFTFGYFLKGLNKDFGVTVILVTHEHDIAAKTKRQIYIKDGQVVEKYL